MTNSREIADRYKKRHDSVLRTIGEISKKNPELVNHFFESLYRTKDGSMNIVYILQYQVCCYKIDLHMPQYNIAVEIDEDEHKYKKDYDSKRQNCIEKQIQCKFIRIKEGESCGAALAKISRELFFMNQCA